MNDMNFYNKEGLELFDNDNIIFIHFATYSIILTSIHTLVLWKLIDSHNISTGFSFYGLSMVFEINPERYTVQ